MRISGYGALLATRGSLQGRVGLPVNEEPCV
jgi:hypothetical protein